MIEVRDGNRLSPGRNKVNSKTIAASAHDKRRLLQPPKPVTGALQFATKMITACFGAEFERDRKVDAGGRVDDTQNVRADLDHITCSKSCVALRPPIDADSGQCACRNVYAVAVLFDRCVLQSGAAVFQMQHLIRGAADGDDRRVDDPVVVFHTAGRVLADEPDQILHDITSRGRR